MSNLIKNFKRRRNSVPKWFTGVSVTFSFLYPFYLVIGKNNLYDYILNFIKKLAKPNENYIYILAYLICAFIFLIITVVFIQLIGYIIIKLKKQNTK